MDYAPSRTDGPLIPLASLVLERLRHFYLIGLDWIRHLVSYLVRLVVRLPVALCDAMITVACKWKLRFFLF